ncbi:hypothetical protein DPMN_017399 [Dreissena polymorpha]|uniref:Uncharacterized protein n=1 Tax=Dreissena polymorpha TaxID=45954 RepID=A0A9D4NBA7_DREPO|nr:hypothetical protein DPMN_017399 [Dreissena polymorpha]
MTIIVSNSGAWMRQLKYFFLNHSIIFQCKYVNLLYAYPIINCNSHFSVCYLTHVERMCWYITVTDHMEVFIKHLYLVVFSVDNNDITVRNLTYASYLTCCFTT